MVDTKPIRMIAGDQMVIINDRLKKKVNKKHEQKLKKVVDMYKMVCYYRVIEQPVAQMRCNNRKA